MTTLITIAVVWFVLGFVVATRLGRMAADHEADYLKANWDSNEGHECENSPGRQGR